MSIVMVGLAMGLRAIHSRNIVDRDVKPANILVDGSYSPNLCDFECSRMLGLDVTQTIGVGTPMYVAPERHIGGEYSEKIDVYAFGAILFEVVFGVRMFRGLTLFQVARKAYEGERPSLEPTVQSKGVNEVVIDVMRQCWSVDPSDRPSFNEILYFFDSINFKIFNDVDERHVTHFVRSIKQSERKQKGPNHSTKQTTHD